MIRRRVPRVIEKGDVFFFYRPRLGVIDVREPSEVQHFYVMLASERRGRRWFRIFVMIGKRLPAPRPSDRELDERRWMLLARTTDDPDVVRDKLSAKRWVTVVRGERLLAAARPVGKGRYRLLTLENRSELAYVLEHPAEPDPTARMFNLAKEARYVTAVRNPDAPGRRAPCYPRVLRARFGDSRWIPATDGRLLDYEHARLLLLAPHQGDALREELNMTSPGDVASTPPRLFEELRLDCEKAKAMPLFMRRPVRADEHATA